LSSPIKPSIDNQEETHWEKAAKTKMGKYLTRVETDFISQSFDVQQENITVMDVGAEAGRFSLFSTKNKATVVSLDIDSYSLKRLKRKNKDVNIILADARKLPLKDEVFDAIFMIEVLDYIPELESAFQECKRTLKPNASCFFSFGNKSSLKAKLKEIRGQSYLHSYKNVMGALSKTGLTAKKKTGYSWLLFGRTSENSLIPALATIERYLGFRRIPRFSPWVIVQMTKLS
jgi:ubiquinone/menaquinone biosynthesis C-methylase UbiE